MKLYFLSLIFALSLKPVCDNTPELNKQVIDYVNSQMGKKVGRGECWDLAAGALNSTGATWDKAFKYGREINVKKECVYPGDIIQFDNVTVEYSEGKKMFKEQMAQHTAVIYEVKGEGDFKMADQNTSLHGRKVGISPMNLSHITKGKYHIYRPEKK